MTELYESTYSKIQKLYESLMDKESKTILEQRLLYSLTNDHSYISDMAYRLYHDYHSNLEGEFWSFLKGLPSSKDMGSDKKVVLFGAGINGRVFYEFLKHCGYRADSFCDNDKSKYGTKHCGLPVISPQELINQYPDAYVIITIQNYVQEVMQQLIGMGVSADNIMDGCPPLGRQYFVEEIFTPSEEEVFIDAGCYHGESALDFINWCHGKYKKIYAFEPDSQNFEICRETFQKNQMDHLQLVNAGLWSRNEILNFTNSGGGDSRVNDSGTFKVNAVSLDEVLNGEKATFIKMDIEGSELEALKGAKQTIQKYRPKLAICLYHKPEDVLDIPLYIKSLVPDYKFYIRHYTLFQVETVLYAI
ncbi:MAG: hypothetical protein K0Q65_486 [Clostridia bacterium]|nr:hypothetical protein [Clostridia bacterium]